MRNQQAMSEHMKADRIAAKLYEIRAQQMSMLSKDDFITLFQKFEPIVLFAMKQKGCGAIEALESLIGSSASLPNSKSFDNIIIAVACEMIDPTVTAKPPESLRFKLMQFFQGLSKGRKGNE
jgi:hypothetical protein